MPRDRIEAVEALTEQMRILADHALDGIDHATVMTAVWGVTELRVDEALIISAKRGVPVTDDELFAYALFGRLLWGLDDPRNKRPNCAICCHVLPRAAERLCQCFRAVQVGQHTPCTWEGIELAKTKAGAKWATYVMETIWCIDCRDIEVIHADRVESRLRQGKIWEAPKFCHPCYQRRGESRRPSNTAPRAPSRPSNLPLTNPVMPRHTDIEAVQQMVVSTSLPAGEG